VTNGDLGRDAHWFDGDGMLSGVVFRRIDLAEGNSEKDVQTVQPEFVNQFILTDVYISSLSNKSIRTPILPSIATLVNPLSSLLLIILRIFRTLLLVAFSHVYGSEKAIKKISVANTGIIYHDGRALATCESGPPIRVSLPGLQTVGWFDGQSAEGEAGHEDTKDREVFGGSGITSFLKEWTTAHPRIDPTTNDLVLFHSTFAPPYIHYSIIPSTQFTTVKSQSLPPLISRPVPGIKSPKMMHDFGVSLNHTVIMDLPLSLDPLNLARGQPVVGYDPSSRSRFGVFPRRNPEDVRWFETNACCIFHTANTWDSVSSGRSDKLETSVNMLACRLTSASLVFSAGDIAAPQPIRTTVEVEEEQCRLYYYSFDLSSPPVRNEIQHQWALSAIPFEFPSMRDDVSMSAAKYIYGCSVSDRSFGAALGRAVKIDALVKIDVEKLIVRGRANPPRSITGCVDERSVSEVLRSKDEEDPIKIFKLPDGVFTQECRFVPRENGYSEDDGWLCAYVFDENTHLDPFTGEAKADAKSELWIIDAKNMRDIVTKVQLPQRVPYGLHGNWFSEEEISMQRPFESVRSLPRSLQEKDKRGTLTSEVGPEGALMLVWMTFRHWVEEVLG
jgi:carotenoid cleavage dioxygenase-like enzyme